MKVETINKANDLIKQIDELKIIQNKAINLSAEWVMFNFGNGANSETVCNDKDHIIQIRQLIVSLNNEKLIRLNKELENLSD